MIVADAFVRILPDDKDFPKQVETSAKRAAAKGSDVASKTLREGFKKAGKESHNAFLGAFSHFGEEIRHRFFAGLQFGVGAFTGIQAFSALERVIGAGFETEKQFQAVTAQTNAVLRSTHQIAGVTAGQVDRLAGSIAGYSGQSQEALVASQNVLLGFTNIREVAGKNNGIFSQTTKLTADLAARFGGTAAGAARALGRALNDPARGLLLLRRAGISFTTQLSDQVKKLAEHGHVLTAQKLILAAVQQRVGGAAAAFGKTLPGELARAVNAFDQFARRLIVGMLPTLSRIGAALLQLGHQIAPAVSRAFSFLGDVLSRTITALVRVAAGVRSVVGWAVRNRAVLLPLAAAFAALTATIVVYTGVTRGAAIATAAFVAVTKGLRGAMLLLNIVIRANPFVAIASAVIALGTAFYTAWKTSESFRNGVKTVFRDIEHAVGAAISFIINAFRLWVDAELKVLSVIAHAAAAALGWVPGLGGALKHAVHEFDAFRAGVDTSLRGTAGDVGNWGFTAGQNWNRGFQAGVKVVPPGFVGPIGPGQRRLKPGEKFSSTFDFGGGGWTPKPRPATPPVAVSPDFTPLPDATKTSAAAAQVAKVIAARAVPVSLTALEIRKAVAAAVEKGRPGVNLEFNKLTAQIKSVLNQPAAHGIRDQLVEFLERRRKSLGHLADRYVAVSKRIADTTKQLTDAQQAQADFFTTLKDTFTSAAQLSNVLSGLSDQVNPGGEAVGGFLQHQFNQLDAFLNNIERLKAEGYVPGLVRQVELEGPEQGGRLAAGLAGATQAQRDRIDALYAQFEARATVGARQLTDDGFQAGIDQLKADNAKDRNELGKVTAAVQHLERVIGAEVGGNVVSGLNAVAKAANQAARTKTAQHAATTRHRR